MIDMSKLGRRLAGATLTVLLAGCSGWLGGNEGPPLPGERIAVLPTGSIIEPDPSLADVPVLLPPSQVNDAWPQAGGMPDHAMGHLALAEAPREAWRADTGSGTTDERPLLARPILAQGRVYTLDTDYRVAAFDARTGARLWRTDVAPEGEDGQAIGGGIAFSDGRIYVGTGFGEVLALDPQDGRVIWRQGVNAPVRAAPTVLGDRVFAVTVDNQLLARSTEDGSPLWAHTGILEPASLLGAASPAARGGIVVVPYSSGELFALRSENGRVAWSDSLAAIRQIGALSNLADIRGMPVIDRGLVLAISHSGRMVAIDERSGVRVWEQDIGGTNMPWVAGDFVFVLDNDGQVVALRRDTGQVRWVSPLQRWRNPDRREGLIIWSGPVLAGNRLWLTNSQGELVALDPANGNPVGTIRLPGGTTLPPVVAEGTLYVLTDSGTLVAFR